MKKTLLICAAVLAGLFIALSLMDTGNYAAEKHFWRLQKQFNKIAQDPRAAPEEAFNKLTEGYRTLYKTYPRAELAPNMLMQVGMVYALQENYEGAMDSFARVIKQHSDNREIAAQALLNIGKTYEIQKNIQAALQTYRQVVDTYPLTDVGMNTPLFIANLYRAIDEPEEERKAYDEAVVFYKKVALEQPRSRLEFDALRLLSTVYLAQEKWQQALDVLEEVLLKYPSPAYLNAKRANLLLKTVSLVAVNKLEDPAAAIKIFRNFMEKNDGHPISSYLDGLIGSLKEIEEGKTAAPAAEKE